MRLRAIALAAMLGVVSFAGISLGAAPAAQAHSGGPPAGQPCFDAFTAAGDYYGTTCYEVDGDDQWVYDGWENGWSTRVQIQTNYPSDGQANKTRWCANTHGFGSWHECAFDHEERRCVRFRLYEQTDGDDGPTRNWTNWTPQISTTTGGFC